MLRWSHLLGLCGALGGLLFPQLSRAQTDHQGPVAEVERFSAELDQLASDEAAALVPAELQAARALVRQAQAAHEAEDQEALESIMALIPIQIQLIRTLLRATETERRADEAERHLLDIEQQSRRVRDELERELERLLQLQVLAEGLG